MQGKFRLVVPEIINTALIISHVGYEKIIIRDPFRTLPQTLFLEEHPVNIDEVTVTAKIDKKKRREMIELFKKYFFGIRAPSCKILNENELRLTMDEEKNEMRVTSHKPLEIINNYLANYRIDIQWFGMVICLSYKQNMGI